MAGTNLIYGLGMLEMGVNFSVTQLMIDADIAKMVLYTIGGIEINDETLSLDVIKEIGYTKDFMGHKNTFMNRKIQSNPDLIDRRMRNNWEQAGGTTMEERAFLKAKRLLAEYEPARLAPEVQAKIRAIVNEAEKEFNVPLSSS